MKQILSTDMKPTKWISLLAKHVLNQIVLETKSKLIILGITHNRKRKGDIVPISLLTEDQKKLLLLKRDTYHYLFQIFTSFR